MPVHGKIIVIKRNGQDGSMFPLVTETCLIGRGTHCDIRIQLPTVSKVHCMLHVNSDGQVILTSVSETQKTIVSNRSVKKSIILQHRDIITISDRSLRFEYPPHSVHRNSDVPQDNNASVNQEESSTSVSSPNRKGDKQAGRRQSNGLPTSSNFIPKTTDASGQIQTSPSPKGRGRPRRSSSHENTASHLRGARVSFGPELSPECFDSRLPPATPIRRGGLPRRRVSTPIPGGSVAGPASQKRHNQAARIQLSSRANTIIESPGEASSGKENNLPALSKSSPRKCSSTLGTPKQAKQKTGVRGRPKKLVRLVKSDPPKRNSQVAYPMTRRGRSLSSVVLQAFQKTQSDGETSEDSSIRKKQETRKGVKPVTKRRSASIDQMASSVLEKRRSVSRSSQDGSKTKQSPVPKIVAPTSPDSKKSAALLTIHAPHLHSSSRKTRSQTKAVSSSKKTTWSQVLQQGLMKKDVKTVLGVPRQYTKRTFKGRRAKKRVLPTQNLALRWTRKNSVTSTGHANSPADIIIRKVKASGKKKGSAAKRKLSSTPKTQRPNLGSSASSLDSAELSGFASLLESPEESSMSSSGKQSMPFDITNAVTPDISQEHFVSPLETDSRGDKTRKSWLRKYVSTQRPSKRKSSVEEVSFSGVKRLLRTPKSSKNNAGSSGKISPLISNSTLTKTRKSHQKANTSPKLSPNSMRALFRLPQQSPQANYLSPTGIKRLMKTPQSKNCDYCDVRGIKELMRIPQSPMDVNFVGVRRLLKTPRTPHNDHWNVQGVRELMRTPKSPHSDYRNVSGVKQLFGKNSPELNYVDPEVLGKLFDAPAVTPLPPVDLRCTGQVAKITAEPTSNIGTRKISNEASMTSPVLLPNSLETKKSRRKQTTSGPLLIGSSIHIASLYIKGDLVGLSTITTSDVAAGPSSKVENDSVTQNIATRKSPKDLTDRSPSMASVKRGCPEDENVVAVENIQEPCPKVKRKTRRVSSVAEDSPARSTRRRTQRKVPEITESATPEIVVLSEPITKGKRGRKRRSKTTDVNDNDQMVASSEKRATRSKRYQEESSFPAVQAIGSATAATVQVVDSPDILETKTSRRGRKPKQADKVTSTENLAKSHPTTLRRGRLHGSNATEAKQMEAGDMPLRSGRRKNDTSLTQNSTTNDASSPLPSRTQRQRQVTESVFQETPVAAQDSDKPEQSRQSANTRRRVALQVSSPQSVKESPGTGTGGAAPKNKKRMATAAKSNLERLAQEDPGEKENISVSLPKTRKHAVKEETNESGMPSLAKRGAQSKPRGRAKNSPAMATRKTGRVLRSRKRT